MNNNSMSGAQAVHALMDIMARTNDENEIEALQMGCRNILKRWSDHKKHYARKHFGKNSGEEALND